LGSYLRLGDDNATFWMLEEQMNEFGISAMQ
jgi:hypothetical protein